MSLDMKDAASPFLSKRGLMLLLAIVAGALLIRVARCYLTDRVDKDTVLYVEMAKDWARQGPEKAFVKNPRIPPLYIAAMAGGEKIGFGAERTGRWVSVAAGTLTVLAAFVLARCVLATEVLALIAAFLVAIHPYLIRFSEDVLRDSLSLGCKSWAFAFAALGASRRGLHWWALAGLASSLSAMTRSEGFELLPALAIWAAFELYRGRGELKSAAWRVIPGPSLAAIVFFMAALPVQHSLSGGSSKWGVVDARFISYCKSFLKLSSEDVKELEQEELR